MFFIARATAPTFCASRGRTRTMRIRSRLMPATPPRSARARHAAPWTVRDDRAARAVRRDRPAETLAERDQEVVDLDPVLGRKNLAECCLGVVRRLGADVTPAVRDAVDVGVDADTLRLEAEREDEVRGLPADAVQREQRVEVAGHLPVEALEEGTADVADRARLRAVEADRIDELRDRRGGELQHCDGIV